MGKHKCTCSLNLLPHRVIIIDPKLMTNPLSITKSHMATYEPMSLMDYLWDFVKLPRKISLGTSQITIKGLPNGTFGRHCEVVRRPTPSYLHWHTHTPKRMHKFLF